ncbi:hypothetical protein ACLB2K_040204 [Fragaria x ananassa]
MATWGNSETLLRLDRAVCTASWFDIFNHSKPFHLPPSDSDHVPTLLKASTTPIGVIHKIHRFYFEEFWLQHEDCDRVVDEAWDSNFLAERIKMGLFQMYPTKSSGLDVMRPLFFQRYWDTIGPERNFGEAVGDALMQSVTTVSREQKDFQHCYKLGCWRFVNHLLFADDSMLYAEASVQACVMIQEVIDTYSRASGQVINMAKSSVVFSKNVAENREDTLSRSTSQKR